MEALHDLSRSWPPAGDAQGEPLGKWLPLLLLEILYKLSFPLRAPFLG